MTHDYDDARDGHEDKDRKAARLNSGIAMLRLVLRDPENKRVVSQIKDEIRSSMEELERMGSEVWEANTQPIPNRQVLGFYIHNDYMIRPKIKHEVRGAE